MAFPEMEYTTVGPIVSDYCLEGDCGQCNGEIITPYDGFILGCNHECHPVETHLWSTTMPNSIPCEAKSVAGHPLTVMIKTELVKTELANAPK